MQNQSQHDHNLTTGSTQLGMFEAIANVKGDRDLKLLRIREHSQLLRNNTLYRHMDIPIRRVGGLV